MDPAGEYIQRDPDGYFVFRNPPDPSEPIGFERTELQ